MVGKIAAIVTVNREGVGGSAPIFFADNANQMEETAFLLEKILDVSVHDLKNGTFILVQR
ncbi:hypothetical protein EBB07_31760 [Paenibacillaceae bacterium]|nr:hypothetical protein EBB07_31760 [Paenibacillaceae bacterium]